MKTERNPYRPSLFSRLFVSLAAFISLRVIQLLLHAGGFWNLVPATIGLAFFVILSGGRPRD